ncbi:MAG TPA: RNA-binding domain-containing protein [Solirubrobacterales bacterium]
MGVTEVRDINQIANMALVEWPDNIQISDRSPSEYFPPLADGMDQATREQMYFWHALPVGWATMEYRQFLDARRKLLAQVVRRGFERLSIAEESVSEVVGQLSDLVEEGESHGLEFKASARINLHTGERDDSIEAAVTRTVAGFANSQGGTLIIGITDDGEPVGLEHDYATLKKTNADGLELWLVDHLSHRIGRTAVARLKIDFPVLHAIEVCRIQVPAAPEPVFVNPPSGEKVSDFFIRIGNSTRALPTDEALQYKAERWD